MRCRDVEDFHQRVVGFASRPQRSTKACTALAETSRMQTSQVVGRAATGAGIFFHVVRAPKHAAAVVFAAGVSMPILAEASCEAHWTTSPPSLCIPLVHPLCWIPRPGPGRIPKSESQGSSACSAQAAGAQEEQGSSLLLGPLPVCLRAFCMCLSSAVAPFRFKPLFRKSFADVCLYVCMYVCMYACMYVCTHITMLPHLICPRFECCRRIDRLINR